jgi:ABC-type iron transport system FetAB ATPase subunit
MNGRFYLPSEVKPMATNHPLRFIKACDLKNLPVAQLLGRSHFVAGGLNVVFGPSGSYKSFYVLGLALEIAQNEGVVYVAAEGSSGLAARVDAWVGYRKLKEGFLTFICEEVNLLDLTVTNNLRVLLRLSIILTRPRPASAAVVRCAEAQTP